MNAPIRDDVEVADRVGDSGRRTTAGCGGEIDNLNGGAGDAFDGSDCLEVRLGGFSVDLVAIEPVGRVVEQLGRGVRTGNGHQQEEVTRDRITAARVKAGCDATDEVGNAVGSPAAVTRHRSERCGQLRTRLVETTGCLGLSNPGFVFLADRGLRQGSDKQRNGKKDSDGDRCGEVSPDRPEVSGPDVVVAELELVVGFHERHVRSERRQRGCVMPGAERSGSVHAGGPWHRKRP